MFGSYVNIYEAHIVSWTFLPKSFWVIAIIIITYNWAAVSHDNVIKSKHFSRYWPFVRGIHRSSVNPHQKRPVTWSFDIFFDLFLKVYLLSWDGEYISRWLINAQIKTAATLEVSNSRVIHQKSPYWWTV